MSWFDFQRQTQGLQGSRIMFTHKIALKISVAALLLIQFGCSKKHHDAPQAEPQVDMKLLESATCMLDGIAMSCATFADIGGQLYQQKSSCVKCHESIESSDLARTTSLNSINAAIATVPQMRLFSELTQSQRKAIDLAIRVATALNDATDDTTGENPSEGGDETTGKDSSDSNNDTPVVTAPLDGRALYEEFNCTKCHDDISAPEDIELPTSIEKLNTAIEKVKKMNKFSNLTAEQRQALVDAINMSSSSDQPQEPLPTEVESPAPSSP